MHYSNYLQAYINKPASWTPVPILAEEHLQRASLKKASTLKLSRILWAIKASP
jgi:hypothetical protein